MRALVYLVVLVFAQSCTATTNKMVNYVEPLDQKMTSELVPSGDKYYVPKIRFDTEVNDESVQQAMILIAGVTEAGAKAIIIEWNTPGGGVDAGFLLARAMEESKVPIICVVDGDAASMGMYLLQSCDVRIMTKRSVLMIHEAAIGTRLYGHEVTWRSIADRLLSTNRAMAEHIAGRMGMDPKVLLEKISGGAQWWINWQEALDVCAVDMVVVSIKEVTESYRQDFKSPETAFTKQ